jgi:hypothetical protein
MKNISTMNAAVNIKKERLMEKPVMNELIAEGGENFFNYLSKHDLGDGDNMLVLSSKRHYYYDPNELQSVTTIINIKKLNLIRHLDSFLQSIVLVLSKNSNFIGCFSDWKTQKGAGLHSRMYKGFINFLDARIDAEYDQNYVLKLLESHGFSVMDMTEINGLTYFRAQNTGFQAN